MFASVSNSDKLQSSVIAIHKHMFNFCPKARHIPVFRVGEKTFYGLESIKNAVDFTAAIGCKPCDLQFGEIQGMHH